MLDFDADCSHYEKPGATCLAHSRAGVLTFYARALTFFVKTINVIYFHFVTLYVMQV